MHILDLSFHWLWPSVSVMLATSLSCVFAMFLLCSCLSPLYFQGLSEGLLISLQLHCNSRSSSSRTVWFSMYIQVCYTCPRIVSGMNTLKVVFVISFFLDNTLDYNHHIILTHPLKSKLKFDFVYNKRFAKCVSQYITSGWWIFWMLRNE
jgi:hypothetical protein